MTFAWRCSMVAILVASALFVASSVTASGDYYDDDVGVTSGHSDVVVLTSDNFDKLTAEGSWMIEFFAPWCGHCKKLKPTWERVATKLRGQLNMATVDCTMEKELQDRFDVKSFPTLKFYRGGSARMYKGERSEEALIKFGLEMMRPAIENVETAKNVKDVIANTPVSFLFIQGSDERSADTAAKVFQKLAYQNQGVFKFMRAQGDKLASKHGVTKDSVVVHLCDGGDDEKFTGAWSEEALRKWIEERKLPLLSELDASNFEDVTSAGKIVIFSVTDPSSTIMSRSYLKEMLKVAKRYPQFVFANIDGIKFGKYVSQFGIIPEGLPTLFALNYPRDEFYVGENLEKYQNENQISRFADDIVSGRIPPRGTSAWYSPVGWYKSFEKFLGTLTETQLIISVTVASVLLIGLIVAGCYYGAQDLAPEEAVNGDKKKVATDGKPATATETKKTT